MRFKNVTVCVLILAAGGAAHAGSFDLAVDSDAFEVRMGWHFGSDEDARFFLAGRYLRAEAADADADVVGVIAAWSGSAARSDEVQFHIGLQGYVGEVGDGLDVEGIGIGGEVDWQPASWKGAFVGARAWFTPSVFTFGETERVVDWAVRGGYRFNPKIHVFVEYASFEADLTGTGEVGVTEGARAGFGVRF